ncbi:excalibur calcium-binding domain-containing protein [Gordonia sp. zg691]|uniref:Excalibur calcium-binding domain-containing protein n=1 Tax=Gordonia jinghuaiqii TaxID=2758710 RepID=A0A7D7QYY0_9ACTN|nr:excalibur calcium-binding domain-containing protein [Gordonia jinghuaiqii]MBD0861966.1 excalibur calcium-binding domain-containing protein [Gordonia jinghuaiqii]MCR5977871.1 calcium-binding protein [Gordonia jinghuaiqii]QMT02528.1 excalibur calcium-binding domain-containing protein [Gordonia jinghuaiqii]
MRCSRKIVLGFLAATSMAVAPLMVAAPAAAATDYANCSALNADYPHGVGEPGAVDSTSGTPVTGFTVDQALYDANDESDRDGDGIACEKR